jgi:hypothetical protein
MAEGIAAVQVGDLSPGFDLSLDIEGLLVEAEGHS